VDICMVMSSPLPPREGIGWYVWNLSRVLASSGFRPQIITRGEPGRPIHQIVDGISVWRPRFFPLYPFHVHIHRLFVQRLVDNHLPQVDLFHLHTPLPPALSFTAPCLLTVHTPMLAERRAIRTTSLRALLIKLQILVSIGIEQKLIAEADALGAVARSVADELGAYGVNRARIRVMGNAVDTDLFCPGGQYEALRPKEPVILAAGRLDVRKGLEDLIESMRLVAKSFPRARLLIAGTGPLRGRLVQKAERMGIGNTTDFLGHVVQAELIELYRAAAVFVHAAHYEGLPTVLLEAMACGRAVVSTAVSGALDVVKDGGNGLLVPPRAPAALAEAISSLLADAKLRARLGGAARCTVKDTFSWPVVGQKYIRYYQDLLGQRVG
jgi:glycosyltransferase involved in cell wall biosynthesis